MNERKVETAKKILVLLVFFLKKDTAKPNVITVPHSEIKEKKKFVIKMLVFHYELH